MQKQATLHQSLSYITLCPLQRELLLSRIMIAYLLVTTFTSLTECQAVDGRTQNELICQRGQHHICPSMAVSAVFCYHPCYCLDCLSTAWPAA